MDGPGVEVGLRRHVPVILLLALAASGCAQNGTIVGNLASVWPHPAVWMTLTAPFVGLAPGTIGHASLDVRDSARILHGPVRWRSNHPEIVEVRRLTDDEVDLLYHRNGRAVITATADGATKSIILYAGPIPRATTIRLRPKHVTVQRGDMIRVRAIPFDSLGRRMPALWIRFAWSDSSRVRFVGVPDWGEEIFEAVLPGCVTIFASKDSAVASSQLEIGKRGACIQKP